ncbi:Zinc transporter ZitB [Metallosphaera sp. J1]|uniref:cation diffusion facilitator family transporter n=1 Tax=Metallosphaera javensis (ex Hofmann et al. 2022) TaxID=99938 RepID=UPI001EDDE88E|nr:cation diffusion facilitator family transporter [Metallosphaera javensis (ex Hofmann et al. 2022)]MCG3109618.1 Zinc transporter ZitB [Metallosphaera javensis (ex Hofmann et al. 2022)]
MRSLLGFWLTTGFLLIVSVIGRSATLGSEALHSILDALVVTLTWRASKILNRRDGNYTYGMHRLEVLYSLLNVITVVVGVVIGLAFSVTLLVLGIRDDPRIVIFASLIALGFSLLSSTEGGDEMRKGIKLHALLDSITFAMGALVGLIVLMTGVPILDPLGSMAILGVVALTSLGNVKEGIYTLMERSPVDVSEVENTLRTVYGTVHHVHVWNICPHMRVATLHVKESPVLTLNQIDEKRREVEKILKEKFEITHVTIQFESKDEVEQDTRFTPES